MPLYNRGVKYLLERFVSPAVGVLLPPQRLSFCPKSARSSWFALSYAALWLAFCGSLSLPDGPGAGEHRTGLPPPAGQPYRPGALPGHPHRPPAPAPCRRRYPPVPIPSCPCLLPACGPDIGHLGGELGRFRLLRCGPEAAQECGNVDVIDPAALDVGHRTRPASPAQVVHGQPCGLTRLLNGLEWRLLLC